MSFLYSPRRRSYSVDRLRVVYADLLQHIDVASEDLGRRGIDSHDATLHKKSKRFSFRRNVIPSNSSSSSGSSAAAANATPEKESRDAPNVYSSSSSLTGKDCNSNSNNNSNSNSNSNDVKSENLAAAFRILAATRSPDKEGDNLGAAAVRDDASVSALSAAKAIESRVVELIQTLGEIIVNGEQQQQQQARHYYNNSGTSTTSSASSSSKMPHVRNDPVFEYFCERSILSLLVDIAKEVRYGSTTDSSSSRMAQSSFHGVVWSPLVKAQVLQTTSMLISDVRNHSVLHYLLSHNYVNELIGCMLPLQQWTDPALSKMMPAYVNLLKSVTVQLADDPHLFPFLTVDDPTRNSTTAFPLFAAALETATSPFAQSDSQIYGTSLIVAVNIMQIPYSPIQTWVCGAGFEQRILADHLCQRLLDRYYRIANLTTGPIVDGVRSNAISGQLAGLKDHMGMIQEVLWSGVRGLDVRLCESLLQRVVTVLLKNLLPSKKRQFLVVGVIDGDVIPESEALAQVSVIFLACLFSTLEYIPFQRMLAVALFHSKSTPIWSSLRWIKELESDESYVFMPALSDIVNGEESRETCPNLFREEIEKGLRGDYGEWRTVACACLVQSALRSEAIENDSLTLLNVVPNVDMEHYEATNLEKSIASYLSRQYKPSPLAAKALECVGYLAVAFIHRAIMKFVEGGGEKDVDKSIEFVLSNSPVWAALLKAKCLFASEALECQEITGVSDIFLDLVESAVTSRYRARFSESGSTTYSCLLSHQGCAGTSIDSEILVRKLRGVSANDVETSRFFINMTLHYRALCKVIDRLGVNIRKEFRTTSMPPKKPRQKINLDFYDKADSLTRTIGGLADKPAAGSDLDLTGRMTFRFRSALKRAESQVASRRDSPEGAGRIRKLSGDMGVFRSNSHLMLVLDPTDMFVVKPMAAQMEENRGTVLCNVSLRSVIAAAADGAWLHVAVRREDVGFLIKNGNMALEFESVGTCLIVKQYLDRSRAMLRQELLGKVSTLLAESSKAPVTKEEPNMEVTMATIV